MNDPERCIICGEQISEEQKKNGNYGEMFDPESDRKGIVHVECALALGWEQA